MKYFGSDKVLIERLLPDMNGNAQDRMAAWGEWYAAQGEASVLAFVRAKNNTSVPDMDILQEAMITAYTKVECGQYELRSGVPFAAYVKGIARNKIREARRKTRRFVSLEDTPHYLFASDELALEVVVERQEQQACLKMGLSKLTLRRRQVLERYLGGQSTVEIANALGMSAAAVRQHKSRGLRSLKKIVA